MSSWRTGSTAFNSVDCTRIRYIQHLYCEGLSPWARGSEPPTLGTLSCHAVRAWEQTGSQLYGVWVGRSVFCFSHRGASTSSQMLVCTDGGEHMYRTLTGKGVAEDEPLPISSQWSWDHRTWFLCILEGLQARAQPQTASHNLRQPAGGLAIALLGGEGGSIKQLLWFSSVLPVSLQASWLWSSIG